MNVLVVHEMHPRECLTHAAFKCIAMRLNSHFLIIKVFLLGLQSNV